MEEIELYFKKSDKSHQEYLEREIFFKTLRIFEDILDKYTLGLGHNKYQKVYNPKTINEIMKDLTISVDNLDLWWTQGYLDNRILHIEKFKSPMLIDRIMDKIPFVKNNKWVLGDFEIDINCIWIFKYGEVGGSIFIIESMAMKSFGIFNNDYETEEVALFNNSYIPASHSDNGWTEINEKKVKVKGSITRIRNLYKDIFFIAPWASSIIGNNNVRNAKNSEEILNEIYKSYRQGAELNEELLSPLKNLRRKSEICMYC